MNRTIHTDDDVPSCLNPVELCLIIIKDSIQYLHSLNMNGGVYMDILGTSFHWCSGNNNSLTWWTRAQACSSVMGAENTLRIWSRSRQSSESSWHECHILVSNVDQQVCLTHDVEQWCNDRSVWCWSLGALCVTGNWCQDQLSHCTVSISDKCPSSTVYPVLYTVHCTPLYTEYLRSESWWWSFWHYHLVHNENHFYLSIDMGQLHNYECFLSA